MRTITRTTNPNGTYRYEIDGDVIYKASKVLYTHTSTYSVGTGNDPVLFHKTQNAANKATGYRNNGWVKTGVQAIEDGDAAATADADDTASDTPRLRGTKVEYLHAATGQWRPATVTGYRAYQDTYVLATDHGSDAAVAADVRTLAPATVDLWETHQGETHGYDHAGNRVIEISERTRPNAWNGHASSNTRTWAVLGDGATRHGVIASGTADGLRAAKRAALAAWAEVMATPAPEAAKVPRVRAKVVANAGPSHLRGRQGRVESKGRGDDGELYVTVEFEPGVTWPFLVSELTLV